MSKNPMCFVISPIGMKDRAARWEADAVMKNLIEPALEMVAERVDRKIVAKRSDQDRKTGDILHSVIERIVEDDVVIAVLFGRNPNVYYELGVADSAARPVVMLKSIDEDRHFDIGQKRMVEYTIDMVHDQQPAAERPVVRELAEAIYHAIETQRERTAFMKYDPLARGYHDYRIFDQFRDLELAAYGRFFAESTRFIGLMGVSLHFFTLGTLTIPLPAGQSVSFAEFVQAAVFDHGYDVALVMMHEDNAALPQMLTAEPGRMIDPTEIDRVRNEIRVSTQRWQEHISNIDARAAGGKTGSMRLVKVREGLIHHRLSITDRGAIMSPYFYSIPTNSGGPAIKASAGTSFYDALRRDFDHLVRVNEPTFVVDRKQVAAGTAS